MEIIVGVAGFG